MVFVLLPFFIFFLSVVTSDHTESKPFIIPTFTSDLTERHYHWYTNRLPSNEYELVCTAFTVPNQIKVDVDELISVDHRNDKAAVMGNFLITTK